MTRILSLTVFHLAMLTSASAADKLFPNGSMQPGDILETADGKSQLVFTESGELVHIRNGKKYWHSATHGLKPKSVHLQTHGNTIIHFQDGLLWALDDGGHPNATMEVTSTDVVMRNADGKIYWRGSSEIGRAAWGRISVYDGKFHWKFLQCKLIGKTMRDAQGIRAPIKASGFFVGFDVRPTNIDKLPVTIQAPRIVDSKGREYEASFEASLQVPRAERFDVLTWPHKVNPMNQRAAKLIYDIPFDAGRLSMKFEAIDGIEGSSGVTVELPVSVTPKVRPN